MRKLIKKVMQRKEPAEFYINGIHVNRNTVWQDSLEREMAKAYYQHRHF